jgi:acyl carrier protein
VFAVIAERVKAVVAGQFDVDEDDISNDLSFEELGADQIDVAELIEALADEFEIEIPTEYSDNIVTVGDAVSCVKKCLRNNG